MVTKSTRKLVFTNKQIKLMWKDFQYVKFNFSMLAIKLLKKMTHFYAIFL